ncbi:MAG: VOC family protein [Candidatus Eremiobacteraeota bacterium]|nr:VOC family protein [Candidatus Eremiobacteraeota bacterium]
MKTHISLQTHDLKQSVAFYKTLLHREPTKHFDDYAFFAVEDPALELAVNPGSRGTMHDGTHYGIAVDNADSVDAAIERLKHAGYPTEIEIEETCCYAKQTKVWTSDPDGRRWEVYTVLEESAQRDDAECCATA